MLSSWWKRWRRIRTDKGDIGAFLQQHFGALDGATPQGALATWLDMMGRDPGPLSSFEAKAWHNTWIQEQEIQRKARIHPFLAGATITKRAPPIHNRTGRQLFRERMQGRGVRGSDGTLHTNATDMEQELWEERAPLWSSSPDLPAHGQALLDEYFRNRLPANLPSSPSPKLEAIERLILS